MCYISLLLTLVVCRNCKSFKEHNYLLDGQSEGEKQQQQQCLWSYKTFRFLCVTNSVFDKSFVTNFTFILSWIPAFLFVIGTYVRVLCAHSRRITDLCLLGNNMQIWRFLLCFDKPATWNSRLPLPRVWGPCFIALETSLEACKGL